MNKHKLLEILDSPFTSAADKQQAQQLLDEDSAPAPAPVAPARAVSELKYLNWIPVVSAADRVAFHKLEDDFRADIKARLAKAKAETAAAKIVAPAPQDTNKARLLAIVSDANASEADVLSAKIELAALEIEEFNQSRALRTPESGSNA